MKGKLTKLMMVAMVLVMALSLMTTAFAMTTTTTVSAATDKWSRMDLPTTNHWQMAPNTDIWDVTAADDGTLFALVEDTSDAPNTIMNGNLVWNGLRWAVYPAWSDVALFKSTDGGYTWDLAWHMPSVETGVPIAVVPQPGYNDADATNDVVFVATGARYIGGALVPAIAAPPAAGFGNVYYSTAGSAATQFTRITPACPGVAASGSITSLDITDCGCVSCPSSLMAAVGVTSDAVTAQGEGVYTWNRNGTGNWEDLQVSNSMVAPPAPGTLPAGNGLDVLAVKFAKYETEKGLIVVVNDTLNTVLNPAPYLGVGGIFVCFYDGFDGYWGGDVDSPTNIGLIPAGVAPASATPDADFACLDIGSDYGKQSSARVYVGIDGSTDADDVWRVTGLSTTTGPSTAVETNLVDATGAVAFPDRVSDVLVPGTAASGVVYAACVFPVAGQAQVFVSANINAWPSWTPSFKPPSGAWPGFLASQGENIWAAGGGDGLTWGGVHVMVEGADGCVYNGIGLLDDIAVSEDIPGYASRVIAAPSEWCLAEAVAMDVSQGYATDNTIFVSTFSEWANLGTGVVAPWPTGPNFAGALSLWRWDSRGNWERILYEGIERPDNTYYVGKAMRMNGGLNEFVNDWTWWPQSNLDFDTDPYMFLLGGRTIAGPALIEQLWYSPDKGDTWKPSLQMPLGAIQAPLPNPGLSEGGWWVFDNETVFLGDVNGFIYKTTDRGTSWTEGVRTAAGLEITSIITSPIYSDGGEAGTDQAVLVGTWDAASLQSEVWISQDGCTEKDLENIGAEINTDTVAWNWFGGGAQSLGGTVVNFDPGWGSNSVVYATASGWLDTWELVGPGATELSRIDYTDVGLYRTDVDLYDPAASTWEQLWDADDFNDNALPPKPYSNMVTGEAVQRIAILSGINFAPDGTIYVSYTVWDSSYNYNGDWPAAAPVPPSPNGPGNFGRHTDGGVLRCLDGTAAVPEVIVVDDGMGHWDGLWLNGVAAATASNHVIDLAFDWQEWRFKLALYEDTLSGDGPAVVSPASGATGVGALVADTSVNVPLSWAAKGGASTYEWQVSEDSAFTTSITKSGETADLAVTVLDLKPSTTYYWRARAVEPMISRWNAAQEFTTVIGGDTGAPAPGSPEDGATITDSTPLFTWDKVASATNYELQVATSPTFGASDIVIDETLGDVQAYEADKELVNGTYYWRVRGTNAATGVETPWSFGSFTLDTGAEGTSTPVWVWVLIVLGVLLGIVVLVLILRTRRPV